MSLKPVWIILAASTDLVKLAEKHLAGKFPEQVAKGYKFGFSITNEIGARLFLHDGGPVKDWEWEEKERAQLEAWGLTDFVHTVESKDPGLTIELIARLRELTDLAVDDDMGTVLKAQDFLALAPDQQVSFVIGNGI